MKRSMAKILCIISEGENITYLGEKLTGDVVLEQFHNPQEAIKHYESEFYDAILTIPEVDQYRCEDLLLSLRFCGDEVPFIVIMDEGEAVFANKPFSPDLFCDPEIISKFPELILDKIVTLIETHNKKLEERNVGCCDNYSFLNCFNEAVAIVDRDMKLLSFNTYFLRTAIEYGACKSLEKRTLMEVFPFLPARIISIFRTVFTSKTPLTYNHEFTLDDEPVFLKLEGYPIGKGVEADQLMLKIRNTTTEKTVLTEYRKLEKSLQERIIKRTDELKRSMKMLDSSKLELSRILTLKNVLFEIAEAAVSSLNQDVLFKKIHQSLSKVLDANSFYIGIHEGGTNFSFPYCIDEYDDPVDGIEDMAGSLTNYVFKKGEAMLVDEESHRALGPEGVHTVGHPSPQWLGVPLIANGKKFGIMVVQSYSDNALYNDEDVEVMSYVSNQVASAIERTRQHESLVESRDALEERVAARTVELAIANDKLQKEVQDKEKSETIQSVLFKIADETLAAENIRDLASFIHRQLERLFDVPNFIVSLYDQDNQTYTFPYFVDEKDNVAKWPIKMEGSFTEYMHRSMKPLFFRYSDYEKLCNDGIGVGVGSRAKCWMGCPLITNKGFIGAVIVQSYNDEYAYGEEEFRLLKYISQQIASSIQKKQSDLSIKGLVKDLKGRNEELAFLNKELKSYTYSVSHDLRAPLRHIIGFSGLIQSSYADKLDAEGQDYLDKIAEACKRMSDMVDAFHKLSKVNSYDLKLEEVDISQMAKEIAGQLRQEYNSIGIVFNISPNLKAYCDKTLVNILLNNLLSNAVKFSSKVEHPEVSFRKVTESGKEFFIVSDNGVGFDSDQASRLFIPFQRLHSAKEFKGTGIGLATVYRVVKKHDGVLEASSGEGQGATFKFTLPQKPE